MSVIQYKTYALPVPNHGYYDEPIGREDIAILRSMAQRVKEIAEHPVQVERTILWKKLNNLQPCRIPVFFRILDLYWPEIFPWDTTLKTKNGWARYYEDYLFKLIWHWENLDDDFITEPVVPYATAGTYGRMLVAKKYVIPGYNSGAGAYKVDPVLTPSMSPESVLLDTEVAVDWEETENRCRWLEEVFDGILTPQRRTPRPTAGFFDWFCEVRGMENAMTDLVVRPEWVHSIFQHIVDFQLEKIKALEDQNAFALNNREECYNGGHSHTDELPGPGFDGEHVRARDLWGLGVAQAAVSISPDMHGEFVTQYEAQYLKETGLNTIACCETVDRKMHLYRQIPNLRRISISTFNDFERAATEIGTDYIYSFKPRADNIALDEWNPELDRRYLDEVLTMAKGCRIEIVNQEMITCRGEARRIIDWCNLAREAADKHSS
jgi:hypothetical protein